MPTALASCGLPCGPVTDQVNLFTSKEPLAYGGAEVQFTLIRDDSEPPKRARVVLHRGWNLVSGLAAAALAQTSGELFALTPGGSAYTAVPPSASLSPSAGFWAYLPDFTPALLSTTEMAPVLLTLPPRQFVLIGNPFATPAEVSGADLDEVYDATTGGYEAVTTLAPGQGAWAYSDAGATVSLAPIGTGP